jgi:hypothetical protein
MNAFVNALCITALFSAWVWNLKQEASALRAELTGTGVGDAPPVAAPPEPRAAEPQAPRRPRKLEWDIDKLPKTHVRKDGVPLWFVG